MQGARRQQREQLKVLVEKLRLRLLLRVEQGQHSNWHTAVLFKDIEKSAMHTLLNSQSFALNGQSGLTNCQ